MLTESGQHEIRRRDFLKGIGGLAGLAGLFGGDALQAVEAAVQNATGLSPQDAAKDEEDEEFTADISKATDCLLMRHTS